jgi:hypothetical protein
MPQKNPEDFFRPSEMWAKKCITYTAQFSGPDSTRFIRDEIQKRMYTALLMFAHKLRRENTVRYPIMDQKKFDPVLQDILLQEVPSLQKCAEYGELLGELVHEFRAWLKEKENIFSPREESHPIDSLVLKAHGVDLVVASPLFSLEKI